MRAPLALRVTGANCKNVLATALGGLFAAAGLPSKFVWGDEFWRQTFTPPAVVEGEEEEDGGSGERGR